MIESRRLVTAFPLLLLAPPAWAGAAELTLGDLWQQYRVGFVTLALLVLLSVAVLAALVTQYRRARQGEQRFAALFEHAPEPMLILAGGRYIDCNPAALRMLGHADRSAVIGREPHELSPERQPDGESSHIKAARLLAALTDGSPQRFEWAHLRADGSELIADISLVPARLGDRPVVLCAWHDVTARRRAELALAESETRFRQFFEKNSSVMLLVTPDDGAIVAANAAAARYYGYSIETLVGMSIDRINTLAPEAIARERQKALREERNYFLFRHRLAAGELRDVEVYSTPIVSDGRPLLFSIVHDISERKRAERALVEFTRDFVSFLEQTSDFIYFKDIDSRIRFCSQTLARITGHAHWRDMIGKHDREIFPADIARVYQEEEVPIFRDGKPLLDRIDPYYDAEGRPGYVQTNKWPLFDEAGNVVGIFGISRDITAQRELQTRLQLAASVFTHAREGIMITDAAGTIVDVNEAFSRITGYTREEAVGNNPRMLKSGRQSPEHYAAMWRALTDKGHWYGEVWNRRKNGEVFAEMLNIGVVRDEEGLPRHYVALFSDITPIKDHQHQLEHIAHYDALTNLPNRVLLADRLRQAMAQAHRHEGLLAVVYLDLDGFKAINDLHGHDVGDELLIAAARRMRAALRENDTLARLGGDEFVAVLVELERSEDCEPVLARLLHAASEPLQVGETLLGVTASIGVTLYPLDGADADLLLRHADQAMYQAKQAGRNRYHLFDVDQDSAVRSQRENLELIQRAFDHREFVLHYQPKVNMRTGEIVGAEALIRWRRPEGEILPPAAFLPLIEDHPLGVELGEWVIETALADLATWRADGLDIPVSVNIAARHLQQTDFLPRLRATLARHASVEPRLLELEVLESSALADMAHASEVMHACREIGVRFALDDFGTGYSSLTYLKQLPVDSLKIDQSFVCDMLDDPDDLAIVEGVMGLAAAFRRGVIAEGVETIAHGELLLPLGCELAQGYGIARPMPAAELPAWAKTWRPPETWRDWHGRAMNRDALPLLFAEVEHRAWVKELAACLRGERPAPPRDEHQCRFGSWYDREGAILYGDLPAFRDLLPPHRRVHALGARLLALSREERAAEAGSLLEELRASSDELVKGLRALVAGLDLRRA